MQIQINNLKKSFGEKVAVDISQFTIHHGDIVGLVGNNGAGKTTLFRLLLDLLKADEGQVLFSDEAKGLSTIAPSESEEWKKLTGAYIDDGFLIDFLTPDEFCDFIAKVNGVSMEPITSGTDGEDNPLASLYSQFAAGEIFGLKKLIRDLSAGNKQKVGVIAALLGNPQLLVLDEPFNFLDPSSQNVLKRIITQYHEKTGATIIISSHNLQHTVDISSRIALMEDGKIIKDLPNEHGSAEKELEDYFQV
ncbi:MAG: ABC transporter ATP-binding protein [Prevotella sp.]|nr:ABC transporter ATP-binding protein [Prevotella sp.]MBR5060613.1 ABC transporter ATP-binding protein [Prevotella sp.]